MTVQDDGAGFDAVPVNSAVLPLTSTEVSITIGPTPFMLSWNSSACANAAPSSTRRTRSTRKVTLYPSTEFMPEMLTRHGGADFARVGIKALGHPKGGFAFRGMRGAPPLLRISSHWRRARDCDALCDVTGRGRRVTAAISAMPANAQRCATFARRPAKPLKSKGLLAITINAEEWRATGRDNSHAGGHRFESCRAHHSNAPAEGREWERMTLGDLGQDKRGAILAIAAKHGVLRVRVFGSFARGDARPDSDLDLPADAGPRTPPWFPGDCWPIWKKN